MEGATGSETEQMILLLLLNKILKICNELPAKTRKIVLIDEPWMLLRMKNAAKYVNMIVRMSRKLNITFGFISQRLEDISKEDETGIGKIIDNMETKIILGLEEQAAETARSILRLSESETNKIRTFDAGHALFLTKNHRIHAKFEATNQEKEMIYIAMNGEEQVNELDPVTYEVTKQISTGPAHTHMVIGLPVMAPLWLHQTLSV